MEPRTQNTDTNIHYQPPIDQLLHLGKPEICAPDKWQNYSDLGITEQHIKTLIEMLVDKNLNEADSESMEIWAPVHAWRALGQLKSVESIPNLLQQLDPDDDWSHTEIPQILSMIGPPAIPALSDFLLDTSKDPFARASISNALGNIATTYPQSREVCVTAIGEQLKRFENETPSLNALLIWTLTDLKSHDYHDTIQQAFEANQVDETVCGDWEDVQITLGLLKERITPKRNYMREKYPEIGTLMDTLDKQLDLGPLAAKPKKIGRNDPCPCGSGKKYKKCCLNKPV